MLPILLITLIFAYFIYAAHVLNLHRPSLEALCKPVADWFGEAGNPTTALLWTMVGVLTLVASTIFPEGFDPVAAGAILVDDKGNPIKE